MDLSQARFDRALNLIYATLEDRQAWRAVMDCLHEALGTRAVHLLAFDSQHGTLSYSDGANMAPQIDMEYIQNYQFIDPRVELMRTKMGEAWLHCHEHFDDAFVANDPFYQEFLLPHGARYLTACKLAEDNTATVLLAFLRSSEAGPLPPPAVAFLDRLRPHLQRACRIGQAHFVYSTEALVGHALVDRLRQPVLLMSSAGEIVHVNDAAERLLQATTLVRVEHNRLLLPQRYHCDFFERCAALEQAIRNGEPGAPEQAFNSIHLKHELEGDEVLYGFFNALLPERVMGTFGVRPLIMLFLYHPSSAQVIDSCLLSAAFGLSHAECRVASLLADGMPLKSIADTLGVQYDTVRKQLMSIYKKTSTNRQPELVRLLLHLPAAAAPQAATAPARRIEGKTLT